MTCPTTKTNYCNVLRSTMFISRLTMYRLKKVNNQCSPAITHFSVTAHSQMSFVSAWVFIVIGQTKQQATSPFNENDAIIRIKHGLRFVDVQCSHQQRTCLFPAQLAKAVVVSISKQTSLLPWPAYTTEGRLAFKALCREQESASQTGTLQTAHGETDQCKHRITNTRHAGVSPRKLLSLNCKSYLCTCCCCCDLHWRMKYARSL